MQELTLSQRMNLTKDFKSNIPPQMLVKKYKINGSEMWNYLFNLSKKV